MTFKTEFDAGTSIEVAASDALRVSVLLHCDIEFDFNGVRCIARPGGKAENLLENYYKALGKGELYSIALS